MGWFDKWISKKISTPSGFVLAGMLAANVLIFGTCWIAYLLGGP